MSYNIVINKITREMVKKTEYVGKEDKRANEAGYRNYETEEDIERSIYTQIVNDLVLTDVINAVNGKETK